ncbi:MAG: type II secretion system protein [Anaerolineae bacterium]|nr:type II secretion system protein [Anaerolineae bacterium]
MRKEQGFTLIELLIVLAILGILVGIVAMSVGGLTDTAKERGMRSELEVVQTAIDTYNTQDVIVDGATAITANTTWTQIDPSSSSIPFAKYLKRTTKYYYIWGAGGANLTVGDDDDPASQTISISISSSD